MIRLAAEIERRIQAGEIGRVQTIFAICGFTLNNPDDFRFDPSMGGALRRGSDWRRPVESIAVPREDGFRLEIEAFAAMIDGSERDQLLARRADSIDVAWTLETILALARSASS